MAHSSDQRREHTHWMRIMSECLDERLKAMMIAAILHYLLGKSPQLHLVREFTEDI